MPWASDIILYSLLFIIYHINLLYNLISWLNGAASIPPAGRYVNAKRAKTGLQRERIRVTLAESETAKGMQNNGKGTGIASPAGSSGPAGGFYRCQRALPTGWQTAGLCTGGHGGPGTGHPLCAGYHLPGVFDEQAHHGLCGDEAMGEWQTGPGAASPFRQSPDAWYAARLW